MNSYQSCVFVLGIVLRNYWPWVSNDLGCRALLGVKPWVSSLSHGYQ